MVRLNISLHIASFATPTLGSSNGNKQSSSGNVCQQQPFLALEIIGNNPPAQSFCSSKFPLARCTSTLIQTVVSTTTITAQAPTITTGTATVTSVGANVTSTTDTATETDTLTTDTVTSNYVTTETETITSTSTATVYNNKIGDSPAAAKKPAITIRPHSKRQAKLDCFKKRTGGKQTTTTTTTTTADAKASQFSSFINQTSSFVSTACSCIETPFPCVTVTKVASTSSIVSATSTSDVQAFSTQVVTNTVTVSMISTTTLFAVAATTISSNVQETATAVYQATGTDLADCTPGCGTYGGATFQISCGAYETFNGATNSYVNSNANTFVDCANACGQDRSCNIFSYSGETATCTLYDNASIYGTNNPDTDCGYGVFVVSC